MKIGITFSSLDLSHNSSIMLLKEAKKQCDYLIVGLQLDKSINGSSKNAPAQSIIKRYIQLKESKHADEIIPYVSEIDIDDILKLYKFDVLIIDSDSKNIDFIGKEYSKQKGIEIYYS